MLDSMSTSTYQMMTLAGWSFILISVGLILIPFLKRRSDLITAWNCVLAACAISLGAGCLEAVDRPDRIFDDYISFNFPDSDYTDSVLRLVAFYVSLLFFYYKTGLFQKFAQQRFVSTPSESSSLLVWVIGFGLCVILASFVVKIPFFAKLLMNISHKSAVFTTTFVFVAWYRNRISLPMLGLFLVTFLSALLFSMMVSSGRRLLLTVCAVPMFSMYWLAWRYKTRAKVLISLTLLVTVVITAGLAYQQFRWFSRKRGGDARTASNVIKHLGDVTTEGMLSQIKGWKTLLGQGCFDYGLIEKRLVKNGRVKKRFLNSLQFIAVYPIPRRYWEGKPEPIGATIVTKDLALPFKTNWGVGITGHSYVEGGYFAIVVYAAVTVLLVRLLDEPLKREPNNPFFIAALVASFAFLVNLVRGDYGVHVAEVLECFLYAMVLISGSRLFTEVKPMAYTSSGVSVPLIL